MGTTQEAPLALPAPTAPVIGDRGSQTAQNQEDPMPPAALLARKRTGWLAVPTALLCAFSVAACGGAHHGSGQRGAFMQCMTQHGVTMPSRGPRPSGAPESRAPRPHRDPNTAPPGVDQNTWNAARAACASVAPSAPAAPSN